MSYQLAQPPAEGVQWGRKEGASDGTIRIFYEITFLYAHRL